MAFENLTLFELHMEGSQFGPRTSDDEAEETRYESEAAEDESGGGRLGPGMAVLLLLVVGAALGYRRYRRSESDHEVDDETEQITIEETSEQ